MVVDKDRVRGRLAKAPGTVKAVAGRITGDTALKTEGQLEKHFGKVQAKYGDLKQDVKQSFK